MKRIWRSNFLRRLPWREALKEFRRRVFPEKRHLSYGSSSLQLLCYGGCGHGWNATWISMGKRQRRWGCSIPKSSWDTKNNKSICRYQWDPMGLNYVKWGPSHRSSWRLPQKMMVSLRDTPRALEGWQESRRAASQPPVPQDRAVMEMMAHAALCWHRYPLVI